MIISVHVNPGSRKPAGVIPPESATGSWVVYTSALAIRGQANEAVIEILARHFGIKRHEVIVKSGHTSRRKIIEIQNL